MCFEVEETLTLINLFHVEMREIDGDMKTLVYENYSKFISATDTIRKVSEVTRKGCSGGSNTGVMICR